jgi:hypothetical protein
MASAEKQMGLSVLQGQARDRRHRQGYLGRNLSLLNEDGFGHMSTMAGAELGWLVAINALEIVHRSQVRTMANYIAETRRGDGSRIRLSRPRMK